VAGRKLPMTNVSLEPNTVGSGTILISFHVHLRTRYHANPTITTITASIERFRRTAFRLRIAASLNRFASSASLSMRSSNGMARRCSISSMCRRSARRRASSASFFIRSVGSRSGLAGRCQFIFDRDAGAGCFWARCGVCGYLTVSKLFARSVGCFNDASVIWHSGSSWFLIVVERGSRVCGDDVAQPAPTSGVQWSRLPPSPEPLAEVPKWATTLSWPREVATPVLLLITNSVDQLQAAAAYALTR
jgi:hypothetical protein